MIRTFTFLILFVFSSIAAAWNYETHQDPINDTVYHTATVTNISGQEFGLFCAVENNQAYLFVAFYSPVGFAHGEFEEAEYRVGDITGSGPWTVFGPEMILLPNEEHVQNLVEEFKVADRAYFRSENLNDLAEFNTQGGKEQIERLMNACQ